VIRALRFLRPLPCVLERRDLRRRLRAALLLKQNVIVCRAVKRRVEVDQVNALIRHVVAQDVQVVAEEKLVFPVVHRGCSVSLRSDIARRLSVANAPKHVGVLAE
jgi:hypothetical protein